MNQPPPVRRAIHISQPYVAADAKRISFLREMRHKVAASFGYGFPFADFSGSPLL